MKSYKADGDGILIVDKRQLTKGTIVPNYVIDLYLPIIKYTGLGLLTTIYRLTTDDKSWNKLRDYMKAGGIGYAKLDELLDLFVKLELLQVERPQGNDRIKHLRTTITLTDAPSRVPEEYRQLVMDATIAKWLLDTEAFTQETFQMEQIEKPKKEKLEEQAEKTINPVIKIKNTFLELLPQPQLATVNHAREGVWAKKFVKFAEQMDWPLDFLSVLIAKHYWELKRTVFWADKAVWLQNVYKDFGAWVYANNIVYNPAASSPAGSGEAGDPSWHPDWRTMDQSHPDFWVVGTRLPYNDGSMECEENGGDFGIELVYRDDDGNIIFREG